MDFEWFRSFISIYKHGSVSEAAKTRMMTQPAMSQHLAALEAEVGEPLFCRTPRKMIPTERGKELYTRVVPLIEGLEETAQNFKTLSSPALPVVKVGAAHEFFREMIAPHLTDFQMRVVAHYGIASTLLEWLQEEKVDVIITSQKLSAPGVEYLPYMQEDFVIVAPPDFPEPAFDDPKEREEWLSKQPWLSYGLELPIIRRYWREFFQKRPQLQPAHVLPDLHAILRAIEHGAGFSLLPTFMVSEPLEAGKVKTIYTSCKVHNELYLAYLIKNRNVPLLKTAIDSLRSILTKGKAAIFG
ncbi:LysR family transcriptional regulator [Brevibacillus nitrificans]|uniref:LysR family transcriptional regulator n=1 Tax=Brevibacillus nitrificans TaxID=651560 RepID=UPI00285939B0|nr:LysR family transcriptional regulator [Brevibacillus nitrificans]MDR7316470.1 DNA-binding transcriptional LysR family regulator [Brevibacillus nitrificans]